jgi:hypothetical protein
MKNFFISVPKTSAVKWDTFAPVSNDESYKAKISLGFITACFMSLLCLGSIQCDAQSINSTTKTEDTQSKVSGVEDHTIRGVVRSGEDSAPLTGTNIYLKGFSDGTSSDANGQFEFPRKLKKGDVLVFSFIGFEIKEYVIQENVSDLIEITLIPTAFEVMGDAATDEIYTPKAIGSRKWLRKNKN